MDRRALFAGRLNGSVAIDFPKERPGTVHWREVIDPNVFAFGSLPLKICMRVVNSTSSNIVLDRTGGEKFLGRGDLLCDRSRGAERGQSPYVTQEEPKALAG
jgi:DNA segregation ATPase FtsK/SpoIIIE-like protein